MTRLAKRYSLESIGVYEFGLFVKVTRCIHILCIKPSVYVFNDILIFKSDMLTSTDGSKFIASFRANNLHGHIIGE